MSAAVPELRKPVMTLVEALWEDRDGTSHTVPARMEDKSAGGACIRIKTAIEVGSKLRIRWRFEQFSGTARYCRREGWEYLVGIQRDAAKSSAAERPVPTDVPRQENSRNSALPVPSAKIQSLPMPRADKPMEIPPAGRKAEETVKVKEGEGGGMVPIAHIATSTTTTAWKPPQSKRR